MKRYITLPKETIAYIIMLVVVMASAMIREINLLIILAGLMLGPLLVNWQVVRMTLGKLTCDRRLPDAIYPDEPFSVDLVVRNGRKRLDSWALVLEDRICWLGARKSKKNRIRALAFIAHLKTGKSASTCYRGELRNRGRYQIGPLKISTRVPLGLFKGTAIVPNSTREIVVYPRLGVVAKRWHNLVKVDQMGQRSTRRNQGHLEGDFYGLRGWRTGDSTRWIHWRSSAKRNELVVRQFEQNRNQNFVILLDLFSEDEVAVEYAISFVASVVVEHCRRHGGNLILGVGGNEVRFVKGSASNAFINEALEILAVASYSESHRLTELLDQGTTSLTNDDRLVVVTTSNAADLSTLQNDADDRQTRRAVSQAICVNVTKPEFSKWFMFDDSKSATSPDDLVKAR